MEPGSESAPWIVVGLGNPGPEYAATRHNVGAMVVDRLAEAGGEKLRANRRVRSDIAEMRWGSQRVVLARPQGYMNESGGPVAALAAYFGAPPGHIVVVHDELDLPFGSLRLKQGGGDNGHNGLRSIRRSVSPETARVRLGIGRPPGRQDPADFVLRPFGATERRSLPEFIDRAAAAVECLVVEGLDAAQNRYND